MAAMADRERVACDSGVAGQFVRVRGIETERIVACGTEVPLDSSSLQQR